MKKIFIILLISLLFPIITKAQISKRNWYIQTNFGIEQHDKRLFHYSEKAMLLALQPEKWGTYNIKISINRNILNSNFLGIAIGFGTNYELATFLRPFDHFVFKQDIIKMLWHQDRYSKISITTPLTFNIRILPRLIIDCKANSAFNIYREINNSAVNGNTYFPYKKTEFKLTKIQFDVGLKYILYKFIIGLHYRARNYQEIDKIIFNNILKDPRIDQKWELYNPLHFELSIGYYL